MIKENLNERIVIERLTLRLDDLEDDNADLVEQYHRMLRDFKAEENEDKIRINEYQSQYLNLCVQKENLEKENEQLIKETMDLRLQNENEIKQLKDKHHRQLQDLENEKTGLDVEMEQLKGDQQRQRQMEEDLKRLQTDLAIEKKEGKIQINNQEREKIHATEKLRKEMMYKIKETKANLLALNDEQLQTTTRLTILQNH